MNKYELIQIFDIALDYGYKLAIIGWFLIELYYFL